MFRKAALAKLSSPEQLDSLMQVTTPKGWMALAAALVVITTGLAWGALGRTAETVRGAGIMLKEGGIFAVESRGGGIVKEVKVAVGDDVEKGQVVIRISQSEAAQELKQQEDLLAEHKANAARSGDLVNRNRGAELRSLAEDRVRVAKSTETLRKQIAFLESRLKAQTEAVEKGLITRDVRQATAQELEGAKSSLIANQSQQAQLDARDSSIRNTADQSVFNLDQEARRIGRNIEQIRDRLEKGTQVLAPNRGRVVSLLVDPGQEVRQGMPVLYIEAADQPLQAVAFIPLQGARIRPGMPALMSPEGITWEEYGYMLGEVVSVTQGPANPDSMNRILRNSQLIQQFTASGSVYEMHIRLKLDPIFLVLIFYIQIS